MRTIGPLSANPAKVARSLRSPTALFAYAWGLVVAGVAMVSVPASFVVGGVILGVVAVLLELGGEETPKQ